MIFTLYINVSLFLMTTDFLRNSCTSQIGLSCLVRTFWVFLIVSLTFQSTLEFYSILTWWELFSSVIFNGIGCCNFSICIIFLHTFQKIDLVSASKTFLVSLCIFSLSLFYSILVSCSFGILFSLFWAMACLLFLFSLNLVFFWSFLLVLLVDSKLSLGFEGGSNIFW